MDTADYVAIGALVIAGLLFVAWLIKRAIS